LAYLEGRARPYRIDENLFYTSPLDSFRYLLISRNYSSPTFLYLNGFLSSSLGILIIDGWANQQNASLPGELTVHLQGVPVAAPYWIVAIGPIEDEKYQWAVVSDEFQISLFVLARNASTFGTIWNETVYSLLINEGFNNPLNHPVATIQDGCTYW
jgi:hypothetical protein